MPRLHGTLTPNVLLTLDRPVAAGTDPAAGVTLRDQSGNAVGPITGWQLYANSIRTYEARRDVGVRYTGARLRRSTDTLSGIWRVGSILHWSHNGVAHQARLTRAIDWGDLPTNRGNSYSFRSGFGLLGAAVVVNPAPTSPTWDALMSAMLASGPISGAVALDTSQVLIDHPGGDIKRRARLVDESYTDDPPAVIEGASADAASGLRIQGTASWLFVSKVGNVIGLEDIPPFTLLTDPVRGVTWKVTAVSYPNNYSVSVESVRTYEEF